MMTMSAAITKLNECSGEQLAELASHYAGAVIPQAIEALAHARTHRPSYAPKGHETRTEIGAGALLNDAYRNLMAIQVAQEKRNGQGARTLISFITPDGATVKTIVRPTIMTEPQRASFLANAQAKGAEVIGWRTVTR